VTPTSSTEAPGGLAHLPMSQTLFRIEQQLREIWDAPVKAGEPVKSRVCTMNLLVVAQSRALAERYTPVVDDVTGTVPARAIIIALEPDSASAALEGDATAVCSVEPGAKGAVCSERITLYAYGGACARVGSIALALAMPELPTVLVWLGRVHTDDSAFACIAREAQRVILDTEYTSLSSLVKLAAWARGGATHAAIADLSWTRLSVWQELTARFFDPPEMRAHANAITGLTLRQCSNKGARLGSEGALFLGWIATRLGWRVERLGGAIKLRRPDGAHVAVKLETVTRPSGEAPSALTFVGISTDAEGVEAAASIERHLSTGLEDQSADADVLTWRLEIAPTRRGALSPRAAPSHPVERQVRLYANKEAELLVETLHRPILDPALSESVVFAEELSEDGLLCS
jgi:glucose-6-phosphate dehydrogenase assembly protein OpcA